MGCVAPENNRPGSEKASALLNILDNEEVRALKLIYADISERHIYEKIDYENFLLFFRKNGLWGSTLFKHFDLDQSDLLAEHEFILGIARISKSTQEEKAKLLFSHFAKSKFEDGIDGILFKDFVRMLYNYPKNDLRQILHDQHFFEQQIKQKLIVSSNNTSGNSSTGPKIPEKQVETMNYVEEKENNAQDEVLDYDHFRRSNEDQGIDRCGNLNQSLTFFLYNKKLNVKMTSIHALVRKYGEMIFKDEGINIKFGRIKENQFVNFATKHPKLYTNYYGGFHRDIWSINEKGRPSFLDATPEKTSVGVFVQQKAKIKSKKLGLLYIKNFLLLHELNKKENIIKIIYLEGLDVKKIFDEVYGFGISISHRNGIYNEKRIYFLNEQITLEWVEALKFYRSQTLYQQFTLGKRIGAGKYSQVFECEQISTGKQFALKEVQTYKLSEEQRNILANESKMLAVLDHPNMPKFEKCFITKTHNYIVLELVKGVDLYEYVREKGKLTQIQAIPIVKQIVKGLIYLQSLGIVHRDLKPDNIMLLNAKEKQQKPKVKVLDFGFANYVEDINNMSQDCKAVGTPNFIAPQLLKGELISEKIDNFSLGSIVYYMLSGTLPFAGQSVEQVFVKTKAVEYQFANASWKKVSQQGKNFISQLMTETGEERIDLKAALKHKWISQTIIRQESSTNLPADMTKKKKSYEVY